MNFLLVLSHTYTYWIPLCHCPCRKKGIRNIRAVKTFYFQPNTVEFYMWSYILYFSMDIYYDMYIFCIADTSHDLLKVDCGYLWWRLCFSIRSRSSKRHQQINPSALGLWIFSFSNILWFARPARIKRFSLDVLVPLFECPINAQLKDSKTICLSGTKFQKL